MKLTEHFTTHEFERSETAQRLGIKNKMPQLHAVNAMALCVNVLEKVRTHFGKPVTITSGYRSAGLNEAVGGSRTSQHSFGKAADIVIDGVPAIEVFRYIVGNESKIHFDQCIYEMALDKDGNTTAIWVHVSFNGAKNRRQSLKGVRRNGRTTYTNFKGERNG